VPTCSNRSSLCRCCTGARARADWQPLLRPVQTSGCRRLAARLPDLAARLPGCSRSPRNAPSSCTLFLPGARPSLWQSTPWSAPSPLACTAYPLPRMPTPFSPIRASFRSMRWVGGAACPIVCPCPQPRAPHFPRMQPDAARHTRMWLHAKRRRRVRNSQPSRDLTPAVSQAPYPKPLTLHSSPRQQGHTQAGNAGVLELERLHILKISSSVVPRTPTHAL
jgi:hypothetical protein